MAVQTNFRGVDMLPATPNHGNTEAVEQSGDDGKPAEPKPLNAADVLAQVGDDKALAQAALNKERKSSSPRKGLTASLEEIIAR